MRAVVAWLGFLVGTAAVELPGIPGPTPLGGDHVRLGWNNDAFGPGGGGKSDDYRTNELTAAWIVGPWVFGLDHSMLTSSNPTGAPVLWGLPNPFILARAGEARRDELTASAGWRGRAETGPWSGWVQAGAGVVVAGRLGGEELQNATHAALSQQLKDMPYEDSGPTIAGLGYGGLGGAVAVAGPLRVRVEAMASRTAGGFTTWRGEALAVVGGAGGGMWAGWRLNGWSGAAPSVVAAVTAQHETGPALTAGLGVDLGGIRLAVDTARNLETDAQDGTLSLTWLDQAAAAQAPGERRWDGRLGLVGGDSRVGGRGVDYALACVAAGGWEPSWRLGWRDQELSHPYDFDIAARRRMLWLGGGVRPTLLRGEGWRAVVDAEAGAGCRWSRIASHGYIDVDGGDGSEYVVPVARAAGGLGLLWSLRHGPELGMLLLADLSVAPSRSAELIVCDPYTGVERQRQDVPLEGTGWCMLAAANAGWRW